MRRKGFILAVLLLVVMACTNLSFEEEVLAKQAILKDTANKKVPPKKTPKLQESIIAHWRIVPDPDYPIEENVETHYYFSKSKLIMVEPSKQVVMNYKVIKTNEKERWVRIKVTSDSGSHIKTLVFKDSMRKSFTEIFDFNDYQLSDKQENKNLDSVVELLKDDTVFKEDWEYIDGKTSPSGKK